MSNNKIRQTILKEGFELIKPTYSSTVVQEEPEIYKRGNETITLEKSNGYSTGVVDLRSDGW